MAIIYITENNTKCYGVTFKKTVMLKYRKLKIFLMKKILYIKSTLWKQFEVKAKFVR